jgi:hypothetical protein
MSGTATPSKRAYELTRKALPAAAPGVSYDDLTVRIPDISRGQIRAACNALVEEGLAVRAGTQARPCFYLDGEAT